MEWNKGRLKSRTLQTLPTTGETVGFPFAEQIAQLRRQSSHRNGEVVSLVGGLEPARLSPLQWLQDNRLGWAIENGPHLRLDVSHNDGHCRIRTPKGLWIMGMFRRIANSLFVHWQSQHPKPQHKTTTDVQAHCEEENRRRAMIFVSAARPRLKPAS